MGRIRIAVVNFIYGKNSGPIAIKNLEVRIGFWIQKVAMTKKKNKKRKKTFNCSSGSKPNNFCLNGDNTDWSLVIPTFLCLVVFLRIELAKHETSYLP